MKKSLLIIGAVAILGMLAVYAIPLTTKNTLSASSSVPVSSTVSTQASSQATSSATTPQAQMVSGSSMMSSLKDGSYTGTDSSNPFGDVQVKLTISGGKITDVATLSYPSSDRHSLQISQYAIPELKQEAIAAQSANIDAISGASYTSQSYVESLQSAINQAKA